MPTSFERSSITLEAAHQAVAAAAAKAMEIGVPMAIAVVDPDGILKAFSRMDGVALLAVRVASRRPGPRSPSGCPLRVCGSSSRNTRPCSTACPTRRHDPVCGRLPNQRGREDDWRNRGQRRPLLPGPGVRPSGIGGFGGGLATLSLSRRHILPLGLYTGTGQGATVQD